MIYKLTHYYLNWISRYYVYLTDQNVNAGTYHLEFLGRRTLLVKDKILPLGEIGFTLSLIYNDNNVTIAFGVLCSWENYEE